MNLTEEEKIIQWAKCADRMHFPSIDTCIDSYFTSYCDEIVQMDLRFSSIQELKLLFEKNWEQNSPLNEIVLQCAIAAFKNKPETSSTDDNQLYAISDYIYNF